MHDRDDFGKELMLANKRKYQLEGKVRKLEIELNEAHNTIKHLDLTLKSEQKYLWLEKERSATLEQERHGLNEELAYLRRENEQLKQQLDAALNVAVSSGGEEGEETPSPSGKEPQRTTHFFDELERAKNEVKREYEIRMEDVLHLKNHAEWRLGEVTKNWNDAKWR